MSSELSLVLPQGVIHQKQQDYDIVAWSNQEIPKNRGFFLVLLFALIFAIAFISYFSYQLLSGGLNNKTLWEQVAIIFFYVISWLPCLGILFAFQTLNHSEAVKISDAHITIIRDGFNAPKNKRFSKDIVLGLSFANHRSDGREVFPSLNILVANQQLGMSGQDREILANWMRSKEKYQLFLLLQYIFKERGWDIEFRAKEQV